MSFRAFVLLTLLTTPGVRAYSVLTHEALIDSAWEQGIKPVLQKRYPAASEEDLKRAHAYAYGGAIIQDLGYYPLGDRFFSDLVHFIRAGDFVEQLIVGAKDVNELAFALGSLAHNSADNYGHPIGINRAVPLVYPKLKRKFGDAVTYADDASSHLKVEFGFDVTQVAQGHYAPEAYHDFIGFEVAKDLLQRAFHATYLMELKSAFLGVDVTLGTFRWTVSQLIPHMTKTAWALHENSIEHARPGTTRQQFVYNLSRASFEKEWGNAYKRPGFFSRFQALLFRIIPKVGPFRALAFRAPGPEAQKLIMASFNEALKHYREQLGQLERGERLHLINDNLDTGEVARYGTYKPADKAVDKLVRKLVEKPEDVPEELRRALGKFYAGKPTRDRKARHALAVLRLDTQEPADQIQTNGR
jgi:hypothetical protein